MFRAGCPASAANRSYLYSCSNAQGLGIGLFYYGDVLLIEKRRVPYRRELEVFMGRRKVRVDPLQCVMAFMLTCDSCNLCSASYEVVVYL